MNKLAKAVLACENLTRSYRDGEQTVDVLRGVNAQFHPGERVAIVGASGSGKSTFLHVLCGLDKPTQGKIWVAGERMDLLSEVKKGRLRNRYLGFIYQFHHLLPEFNVQENVMMPLLIQGVGSGEAKNRAAELLIEVGLKDRITYRVQNLSGGERQRVAICRALVTRPTCVVADEPTGNLDQTTAQHMLDLMLSLSERTQTCLVVVTHDLQLASRMDRVLTLSDGRLSDAAAG